MAVGVLIVLGFIIVVMIGAVVVFSLPSKTLGELEARALKRSQTKNGES